MRHYSQTVYVYLIDSDEGVRTSLTRLLRATGMHVTMFTSMASFLAHAPVTENSCIIVDISTLSAHETVDMMLNKAIKSFPPMIAISDRNDDRSHAKAHEIGAKFLLHKPVDGQALLDAIHWVTDVPNSRQEQLV